MNTAQKLVMALQNLRDDVADYVQEVGGCDHAVGVCVCRELEHLFQADAALEEAREDSEEDDTAQLCPGSKRKRKDCDSA